MTNKEKHISKGMLMDAEEISTEIFGGKITARNINERYSYDKGFPKAIQRGTTGKKFWRRSEIYAYYKVSEMDKAA